MTSADLEMADKQLQPRRAGNYSLTQPARQRGLWGQIWMTLLQPGQFFRALPAIDQTRQWLWAGLLILGLIGFSAVRQTATPAVDPNAFQIPTDSSSQPDPNVFGGGDFGAPPEDGVPPGDLGAGAPQNTSATWTTVLVAASGIVMGWFIQSLLLCEVSLLKGFSPRLGRNFQIAIWASLPLAFMAVLQLLYYAAGGSIAGAGVSGFVTEISGYADMQPFVQAIILSFATQLTLFWLWNLALIYVGARRALHGRWWSSLLVVIAWSVILVVVPVLNGAIKAPEPEVQSVDLKSPELPPEALPGEFLENMMSPGATLSETPEPNATDQIISPIEPPEGSDGASKN
jgi:Yip1 domain